MDDDLVNLDGDLVRRLPLTGRGMWIAWFCCPVNTAQCRPIYNSHHRSMCSFIHPGPFLSNCCGVYVRASVLTFVVTVGSSKSRSSGWTPSIWYRTHRSVLEHELERGERMREGRCYRPSVGLAEELAIASVKKALSSWSWWRGATQSSDDGSQAAASRWGRWRRFLPPLRSLRSD